MVDTLLMFADGLVQQLKRGEITREQYIVLMEYVKKLIAKQEEIAKEDIYYVLTTNID